MIMTKQRTLILQYFKDHPDQHPTADEVYEYIRPLEKSIGIATVYRNLRKLVETGMLRELNLEKQGVRYDLASHEHYHFICNKCGNIENFVIKDLLNIDSAVESKVQGKILQKDLIFHGVCSSCLEIFKE